MRVPDRIHFFSWETGVSIELPVGFSDGGEQPGGAVYVSYDDDDEVQAAVIISAVDGAPPGGAGLLVDAMASVAQSDGTVGPDRDPLIVDDETVDVAELRFPGGLPSASDDADAEVTALLGGDIYVVFAATTVGARVVTLTAAAPHAQAGAWRDVFAEALRSCRFVAVEEA